MQIPKKNAALPLHESPRLTTPSRFRLGRNYFAERFCRTLGCLWPTAAVAANERGQPQSHLLLYLVIEEEHLL